MAKSRNRRGRHRRFATKRWVPLPLRVPEEMKSACRLLSFRRKKGVAELLRDLLELELVREGLLKVQRRVDETGTEVRAYEVVS